MALEPGTQLGSELYCQSYDDEQIQTKQADYLNVRTLANTAVNYTKYEQGPFLGIGITSENAYGDVYLNETQVDDLIVTLLYWKENH